MGENDAVNLLRLVGSLLLTRRVTAALQKNAAFFTNKPKKLTAILAALENSELFAKELILYNHVK